MKKNPYIYNPKTDAPIKFHQPRPIALMKKGQTGTSFRQLHALWAWDRKAGMKVPSRKRLKVLARERYHIYGWAWKE
jgi:hypothetical protein